MLKQTVRFAASFARLKTGNNTAAKMAMIAMTAKSSISVNALAFNHSPRNLILMDGRMPPKSSGFDYGLGGRKMQFGHAPERLEPVLLNEPPRCGDHLVAGPFGKGDFEPL